MATTKSPPAPKRQKPPDEKFWVKYSPHHEMTISSLASLAWHTLAIVLVIVVAWVVTKSAPEDMAIGVVGYDNPGGGGAVAGVGNGPGDGRTGSLVEAATQAELPPDAKLPDEPLKDITGLQITPRDILPDLDKETERDLERMTKSGTQTLEKLSKLDANIRKQLASHGGSGPGSGGGNGTGNGTGDGPGNDPNGKINNTRVKRNLRWTITFNTTSGADYLRQVHYLGAILSFKAPNGDLKCVKDLMKRPVELVSEDLKKLNRIFWIDDRRDSVEQLARAMGLDFVPNEVFALFPRDFEEELLKKELAFRNKKESEIAETRFQIIMRGNGHVVVVTDQRLLREGE
jgi:hypothetical protein